MRANTSLVTEKRRTALPAVMVASIAGVLAIAMSGATAAPAKHPAGGPPKVESAPSSLVGLSPQLPKSVIRASSSRHSHWHPEKARYGTASKNNIAVKGAGGTTIRVNEIYPTTKSGKPAKGHFPVVLTMTPYGKGSGGSSKPGSAQKSGGGSPAGGANTYLVQRGYINIVEDVRGTGDSNGSWGLFDPVQQRDAMKVVRWAAHLKHSNGRVGTYGPSYLGIDQMLLAGSEPRHSPLKAIFPVVPANDAYRDTSFMGGLLDAEFSTIYLGLTAGLNSANPLQDAATDSQVLAALASIAADHAQGIAGYHAKFTAETLAGGPAAYDQHYWRARAPQTMIRHIVRNRIPAFMLGGEFDIFQHGEPIDYAELQNAWAGRGVNQPMRPGQRTTGRYQLIVGPWEHLNGSSVDLSRLQLQWFDRWLKHEHTGIAHTPTPLHYYDLGTGKFRETTTYPFTHSKPTHFYFGPHHTLHRSKRHKATTDSIAWSQSGSPCGRPIDQWAMGGISIPAHTAGFIAPCGDDDRTTHKGPSSVIYTTKKFHHARTLAGPIVANVYAKSTTPETQLVAEVEEVTSSGASYPLTEGALLGSLRSVEPSKSWRSHGVTTLPYHPYTKASARPVKPNQLTRYQIEIFPTMVTIGNGDRLRLTLSTSDSPHLTPLPAQIPQLSGGVYTIVHSHAKPSSLIVELRHP